MIDKFQSQIGAIVLALVALGGFAAIVWQIVHQQAVDPLLAGMVTGAIGVLSPSPLKGTQSVQVDQPADKPIPVNDAGITLLDVDLALAGIALVIWILAAVR